MVMFVHCPPWLRGFTHCIRIGLIFPLCSQTEASQNTTSKLLLTESVLRDPRRFSELIGSGVVGEGVLIVEFHVGPVLRAIYGDFSYMSTKEMGLIHVTATKHTSNRVFVPQFDYCRVEGLMIAITMHSISASLGHTTELISFFE